MTLLSMDGYQIIVGGSGGGVGIWDVLFSCDVDITLNLVFLLLYCDKLYIVIDSHLVYRDSERSARVF